MLTIITRVERLRGRIGAVLKAESGERFLIQQARLQSTERFLAEFTVLPFDTVAAGYFDRLSQAKPTRSISRADLLNACITLARSAILVTRNLRDFAPALGLHAEN